MKDTFSNLQQLIRTFKDEDTCRKYLAQRRWNGKPVCPYCKHDKVYNIEGGKRYKCANSECYKKFSVTVGTIFEDSNIPLTTWFTAVYLATSHKKGISSIQLGKDLGVTQKTAWFILHRVREMLKEKSPVMLTKEVEVDETFIGGKEGNKHANKKYRHQQHTAAEVKKMSSEDRNHYNKIAVIGLVERNGKVVAKRVPDVKAKTLIPIIEKHVEKGSTMLTDEWYAYGQLYKLGYTHKSIPHNLKIYVQGETHTNTIENFWSVLKRGLYGIYHFTSKKHLDRYLDEFCARYNTRTLTESERFDTFLAKSGESTLPYRKLVQTV